MLRFVVPVLLAVLSGCATTTQEEAAKSAAAQKAIAEDVRRVCALPTAEREVELKRVKEKYGLVLYCGKE